MKCYRKNGSDHRVTTRERADEVPSMKCYRKNGSDDSDEFARMIEQNPQ